MKPNKKGQGGVNMMSGIAIAVITVVVILFIGFKIGDVLAGIEEGALPADNVFCNKTAATVGACTGTFAGNATHDLLGDDGLGLVRDLIPIMIIAVVGFGILAFFSFRKEM